MLLLLRNLRCNCLQLLLLKLTGQFLQLLDPVKKQTG
jgi:hypothetical protein